MKEKMSIKEWIVTFIVALVLLIAIFGMLGVIDTLAAEITPTPTRTPRPTLQPTSTPWPYTPTPAEPYPGPDDASSVSLVSFTASGGKISAGTCYVVIMTIIIGALVVWLERRLWGKR